MPLPTTLGDQLLTAARRDPDGVALIAVDGTARWTWGELARHASGLARRLRVENRPGTVVAVWAASEPAWVVLELACALAGRLHVEGRLGDVIERAGERWLPSDVEAVLVGCEGGAEAVVVGVDRAGEDEHGVVAFVRLAAESSVDGRTGAGSSRTARDDATATAPSGTAARPEALRPAA